MVSPHQVLRRLLWLLPTHEACHTDRSHHTKTISLHCMEHYLWNPLDKSVMVEREAESEVYSFSFHAFSIPYTRLGIGLHFEIMEHETKAQIAVA